MELSQLKNPLIFFLLLILFAGNLATAQHPADNQGQGQWQLLVRSLGVSAMHMQLLPTSHLVVFDRTDFGPSNLSLPRGHPCRSDPHDVALPTDCTAHSLLLHLPSLRLRPLTVLTDTWCSAAALLPNSTLLQTGGFNDGQQAVRSLTLTPTSTATADWIELRNYLSVRRWYSTDQILPDGRIIVLGGRRQFSYEFVPRKENEHYNNVSFPFLEETTDVVENNLYPFLHLLPEGSLFVFANTRAVLLDYTRNVVLKSLPPIPDGVPRNYPSSGSSVLLPLWPPFNRPEVLVCGGAPYGSFQKALNGAFLPAARSCGRIFPADANPVWSMEDMPLNRVMGDLVLLPSGDVLIINGAGSGTAGWDLGRDPVLTPVLYNPDGPAGSRFRVMAGTTIPRLYHSTAVVDSYGRVLVGGSNPNEKYNFTNVLYPTELSLEAFLPPYLDGSFDRVRPTVVGGGGGSFGYGETVVVRFQVQEYREWAGSKVVAMAPAFSTHSFRMNQRQVVMEVRRVSVVGQSQLEVEAVVPPKPEVAPPGYYMLFVVHAGVPSEAVWIRFHGNESV